MKEANARLSGDLAEAFLLKTFGIRESDDHESKAVARHPGNGIVRFYQLARTTAKTYWFVRYDRRWSWHVHEEGPKKGKKQRLPTLEIAEAYDKAHVDVIAMTGLQVLVLLVKKKRPIQSVTHRRSGSTRFYFRIHWSALIGECIEHDRADGWTLYRHQDLHPSALDPTPIQTELPVPQPVDGADELLGDDIPF